MFEVSIKDVKHLEPWQTSAIDLFVKKTRNKVLKSGPSKSYGRQPLKILLSPLLNTRR